MFSTRTRRWLVAIFATTSVSWTLTVSPGAADTDPADPYEPVTVSTDPLPTVQVNGTVWDQAIVGSTVYVVGSFTRARPAGTEAGVDEVTRSNMLAYDLQTGKLVDGFAPTFNAQVRVVMPSADGTRLYVGGEFTVVNGAPASTIVALKPSGVIDSNFAPVPDGAVRSIAVKDGTVYIGGAFSSVQKRIGEAAVQRTKVAALESNDGAVLPFAPVVRGGTVFGIVVSPDARSVVIGGSFTEVNGSSRPGYGLAMLGASTAESRPLPVNAQVRNGGSASAIFSLKADDQGFYGSGYVFGAGGNLEGSFSATWNGTMRWVDDCHGDTYDVQPIGNVVYSASHKHYCGNLANGGFPQSDSVGHHAGTATTNYATGTSKRDVYGYADHAGDPSPTMLTFFPDFNIGPATGQGPWTVEGNDDFVIYGGEFSKVNGRPQQGLVRFAKPAKAPNADGPRLPGSGLGLTLTEVGQGKVKITWTGNWDRDNSMLTYDLYRGSTLIATQQKRSSFWQLPSFRYVDEGRGIGSTVSYKVRVTDARGNRGPSDAAASITLDGSVADQDFGTFTSSGRPVVTGTRYVGQTLSIDPSQAVEWTPVPAVEPTYQWMREGAPIPGATASAYTLGPLDVGRSISVVETVEDRAAIGSIESDRVDGIDGPVVTQVEPVPVQPPPVAGPADPAFASTDPTIVGTSTVGSVLRASPGAYPAGVVLRYEWLRNGAAIAGGTTPSYTVVTSDAGRSVEVRVTAANRSHTTVRTSAARQVRAYNKVRPRIVGKLRVKRLIRVSKGKWYAAGHSYSYQWFRNGKLIRGASKSTYKLTRSDKGKRMVVRVTAKKKGFPPVAVNTARSSKVR